MGRRCDGARRPAHFAYRYVKRKNCSSLFYLKKFVHRIMKPSTKEKIIPERFNIVFGRLNSLIIYLVANTSVDHYITL